MDGGTATWRRVVAGALIGLTIGSAPACGNASGSHARSGVETDSRHVAHHRHHEPEHSRRPHPTRVPTATPTPTPSPVRPTALVPGHSAWVSVAIARLWETPVSPRTVDAPALAAPVQFRQWLSAMSLTERRALSSYSDTEALMGERVVVRQVTGTWAEVVVPDQPSQKDPGGYPGWIPVRQLSAKTPPQTSMVATVVRPTAWLRRADGSMSPAVEISSGTTLPVVAKEGSSVGVRTPSGARRALAPKDVVVHPRGTAALPPHDGVVPTA